MRPLKIVISCFGTYYEETVIDFTKLGSEGLYLITGDTGSGKTTIFDAITFALYGEPSGTNRDASMLRCSFALPEENARVELDFEFRGKLYSIKRSPKFDKPKKNGEGTTTQNAVAELTLPDGSKLSGVRDVDPKIEDILGISKAQFCQIAMIAQGDFQNILYESSENRKLFFRTLFKTENYQKLQEKLKDKMTEMNGKVDDISDLLNREMGAVSCGENSVLRENLSEAKSDLKAWGEKGSFKIDLIKKIIEEDKKEKAVLEDKISSSQGELDKIKIQISEINKLKEDKAAGERLEGEVSRKEKLIEQLEGTLVVKKEALDGTAEKEKEKTLIGNDLPKYDELDKKIDDFNKLSGEIKNLERAVAGAEENIEKKSEEIKALENELAGLKDVAVNHQKFLSEKERAGSRIESLNDLKNRLIVISDIGERLLKAQEEYKTASGKAVAAGDMYTKLNKAYLDGQAGILANGLEEGVPCPVCGSVHHPSPCVPCGEVPGEDEVNKAKAEADSTRQTASEKSEAASAVSAEKKAKEDELGIAWNKIFGAEKISYDEKSGEIVDVEIKKAENNLREIEEKLLEESSKIKRKNLIEDKIPGEKEKLEKLRSESINNNNQLIKNNADIQGLEKQIGELKEGLSFENKTAANNMIIKLEREIDVIKKSYEDALRNYNKAKDSLNELRGNLAAVKERIESSKIDNEEEVEKRFEELSGNMGNFTNECDKIKARLAFNEKSLVNISNYVESLIKEEKKWKMISSLYYTVVGNLSGGHEKIPLEVYIQTAYLDKILYYANRRLLIMSDNQYELVRREKSANHQGKTGLDLDVIDHYNGKVRDVKSLSGGECFQASLALALGLSDEVTTSAGGIKIDTMFIDEGFGTLDSETIQKAYKALISVTEANKLVGIISHVDYLKEKIDKQIVVKKSRDKGSSVTINV